ncbi:MAG: hypothetical protein KA146_04315 [Leptospiraceae bacterium]|nr:hypothetical protein [Leptospiraceae bacterium]
MIYKEPKAKISFMSEERKRDTIIYFENLKKESEKIREILNNDYSYLDTILVIKIDNYEKSIISTDSFLGYDYFFWKDKVGEEISLNNFPKKEIDAFIKYNLAELYINDIPFCFMGKKELKKYLEYYENKINYKSNLYKIEYEKYQKYIKEIKSELSSELYFEDEIILFSENIIKYFNKENRSKKDEKIKIIRREKNNYGYKRNLMNPIFELIYEPSFEDKQSYRIYELKNTKIINIDYGRYYTFENNHFQDKKIRFSVSVSNALCNVLMNYLKQIKFEKYHSKNSMILDGISCSLSYKNLSSGSPLYWNFYDKYEGYEILNRLVLFFVGLGQHYYEKIYEEIEL